MDLSTKTQEELLDIALHTNNKIEMTYLKLHSHMNVRRALAKNINIDDEILDTLYNDPVQNVSYMASIHPKSKNNHKEFENMRACVTCQKEETALYCVNCDEVKDHNF